MLGASFISLSHQSYLGISSPVSSCLSRRMWHAQRSSDTSEHLDGTSSLYLGTGIEPQGYDSASKVDIWMSTVCSWCLHSHTEQRPCMCLHKFKALKVHAMPGSSSVGHFCGAGRSQSGWAQLHWVPARCSQPHTSAGGVSIGNLSLDLAAPGGSWALPPRVSQEHMGEVPWLPRQHSMKWQPCPLVCSWEIKAESQDASAKVEGRSITIPFNLRADNSHDQVTPSSSEYLLLLPIWVWQANWS